MKLEIIKGSCVFAEVDVIVNAANEQLQSGGGICGAIFKACKNPDSLQDECDAIGYCKTGHAVMTNGYGLNAKHIIHAVGPIYHGDLDVLKLKGAYHNSLVLADNNNLKSIAFPSISTGIYGYPLDKAAKTAITTILEYKAKSLEVCYLYCYKDSEYQTFTETLAEIESKKKK